MLHDPANTNVFIPKDWWKDKKQFVFAFHLTDGRWVSDTDESREIEGIEREETTMLNLLDYDITLNTLHTIPPGSQAIRVIRGWILVDESKPMEGEYLSQHNEWLENQYNEGFFTGGKIPVWENQPGNRKLQGWMYAIPGILWLIATPFILAGSWSTTNLLTNIGMVLAGPVFLIIAYRFFNTEE